MRFLLLASTFILATAPSLAFALHRYYDVTATTYGIGGGLVHTYCLKLVSHGVDGTFRDQGAAYMLQPPATSYSYLGQYRLFNQDLTVVVGSYGKVANDWFQINTRLAAGQWQDGVFYQTSYTKPHPHKGTGGFVVADGTITATQDMGMCRSPTETR
jgi:hypothetical protein